MALRPATKREACIPQVNLDNITILGPGSEWFWSMAQFLVVAITLIGIYRQVKLQASSAAIQQMEAITREWRSEASLRQTLAIELAVRDGASLQDIPFGAASSIGDFWEGIGYLVRKQHIDFELFNDNLGASLLWWWKMLEPWTQKVRIEAGLPEALADFEWLAGRVEERARRSGDSTVFDESHLRKTLDGRIENDIGRIQIAEALRAVPRNRALSEPGRRSANDRAGRRDGTGESRSTALAGRGNRPERRAR